MHTGEELEAHYVEKGHLSCYSEAPLDGSARSDSARVVRVNRRKTNRRKTRPHCIISYFRILLIFQKYYKYIIHYVQILDIYHVHILLITPIFRVKFIFFLSFHLSDAMTRKNRIP
jgi:hypothetical protein